jgi:hypothetical protein
MLKELLYKVALIEEAGVPQTRPLEIFEDNTAAIAISNNPIINKKSKHIDLKYHFIKKHIQDRFAQLKYIATRFQEADILTKVLNSSEAHCLMVARIYNIQWLIDKCESKMRDKTLMIRNNNKNIPLRRNTILSNRINIRNVSPYSLPAPTNKTLSDKSMMILTIESREKQLERLMRRRPSSLGCNHPNQVQIELEELSNLVQSCFEEIMSDQPFNINELILYCEAEQEIQ